MHPWARFLDGLVGPSDFRQTLAGWIDSSYVLALAGGPGSRG
jgi:hypothetical protein